MYRLQIEIDILSYHDILVEAYLVCFQEIQIKGSACDKEREVIINPVLHSELCIYRNYLSCGVPRHGF